ncbi:MAG: tetratricopeptide repeat protein [Victivallales bacterium]
MDRKAFKDINSDLRSKYQTALTAKDIEYGIMLLKSVVLKDPAFGEARDQLRKLEKTKTSTLGFFGSLMATFKTSGTLTAGKTQLARKKPLDALRHAEDALALNLKSLSALNLMAQAGHDLNARFISIEALEIAREYFPKNVTVLDWLADEYGADKQGTKALRIRQEIASLKPGDLDAQQKVRAAAALATMDENKWEDKATGDDSYRNLLKSKGEAVKLEQNDRIARNVDDVKEIIEDLEKQMAAGKGTLDTKRKLADCYQKAEMHDKAIEYYNLVIQDMGVMDPFIDRAIEKSNVSKFEKSIAEWRQYGADPARQAEAESNISTITAQMLNYRLEKALERVNNYPNDLQFKYELGVIYFELGDNENSLQQFQLSQRNPQRRLSSIVYLGQCFQHKKQYDIAIEEYTKAIGEMIPMDRQKKDAVYCLASAYEEMDNIEKAVECYKLVYRADIKYKDVADRMNRLLAKA